MSCPRVSAAHTTLNTEEAEEYFSAEEDEVQCGENDGQARRKEGGTKKILFEDTEAFSYVRKKMDNNAIITDKLFMQLRVQELKQELARACFDAKQQEAASRLRLAEHQEQVAMFNRRARAYNLHFLYYCKMRMCCWIASGYTRVSLYLSLFHTHEHTNTHTHTHICMYSYTHSSSS